MTTSRDQLLFMYVRMYVDALYLSQKERKPLPEKSCLICSDNFRHNPAYVDKGDG